MHSPKVAQSGAENMWRKPTSRQHAPCTDGCVPGYKFRAAVYGEHINIAKNNKDKKLYEPQLTIDVYRTLGISLS